MSGQCAINLQQTNNSNILAWKNTYVKTLSAYVRKLQNLFKCSLQFSFQSHLYKTFSHLLLVTFVLCMPPDGEACSWHMTKRYQA